MAFAQIGHMHHRFKVVDYMTTTCTYEVCLGGRLPKEVPSFKSLWLPFDSVTWVLIVGSAIALGLVLVHIGRLWNVLKHKRTNYLWECSEGRSCDLNESSIRKKTFKSFIFPFPSNLDHTSSYDRTRWID